ncbi:MAG: VRR-NUC domain-containing protein [Firmicutes bacterium]|nr:VRR-NUC domain-containing protein [Bacillota bacterium]
MHQHTLHARTIVRYLQKRGAWVARIRGTWGQRRGLPDILACWQGRLIAIEVKTGSGRLTPAQKREHEALRTAGAVVLVGNAEQVLSELEHLTHEPQLRLL